MSAVATNPRAKAQAAARINPTKSPLEALHACLLQGREKTALAYDAAERGTAVDTLLQHVEEVLLPDALAPIYRKDLNRVGLHAVYEGLFVPLAALEGAIALSTDSVLEHTLREAHVLLDWAQTQMDSAGEIARGLPDTSDMRAADFERGKEIAIQMLDEAEALVDEREGKRWMRDGKAQDNLVRGYLTDIINEPALMDGFTAVLSATIRNDHMNLSEVREITLAETQAGEIGADGTEPHPDSAPTVVREKPPQPAPTTGLTLEFRDRLLNDLRTSRAAADILKLAFAGNGFDEAMKAGALMGILQFLIKTLDTDIERLARLAEADKKG